MPFFQMDDGFDSDSQVLRAGTAAFGLYSRCGVWVSRNLTDGFVPREIADLYGTREWIERLVAAGLWTPVEGGFMMPDYLERHRNWTAERVREARAAAAERQANARERRRSEQAKQPRNASRRDSRVSHTGSHGVSHSSPSPPSKGDGGGAPPTRVAAPPLAAVPDWCGKCDNPHTRLVELGDGTVGRCSRCHPHADRRTA